MDDQQLHDTIEQYLLGELSPAARARLEADMAADPALREQVELQRLGLMGLQRLAGAELHTHFARWDEELDAPPESPPESPAPRPAAVWPWATALLLLLLSAGAFWHFRQMKTLRELQEKEQAEIARRDSIIAVLETTIQQKETELAGWLAKAGAGPDSSIQQEIAKRRAELLRLDKALRERQAGTDPANQKIAGLAPERRKFGTRGDASDPVKAAGKALDDGRFAEAERLLKSIPPDDEGRQASVTRMLPYALFFNHKYGEAAQAFAKLKEVDRSEAQTADIYLLLSYHGDGRLQHARAVRADILKNPGHKYYQKAVDVGKELGLE